MLIDDKITIPVFVHLPKCGGTSVNRLIAANYPWGRVYSLAGRDVQGSLSRLGENPRRVARCQVLQGHGSYGVDRLLNRPVWYFTIVREPVQRILSDYHYIRRQPSHELHHAALRLSLMEMLEAGKIRANMIRDTFFEPDSGSVDDGGVEFLFERVPFIGVLEQLDESIRRLAVLLGWRYDAVEQLNSRQGHGDPDGEDPARGEVAEFCREDCFLYAEILRRFEAGGGGGEEAEFGEARRPPRWLAEAKYAWSRVLDARP